MRELFMVFDVEAIGLHGEGFAVGYVVVDRSGKLHGEALLACNPAGADGSPESRLWVAEHVPPLTYTHLDPSGLRHAFWVDHWQKWKHEGAVLVADCCWPVEARFLAACVDQQPAERGWQGPYPLHEVASVLLAVGVGPFARSLTLNRLPDELPEHNPLCDARQSARLLLEALDRGEPA